MDSHDSTTNNLPPCCCPKCETPCTAAGLTQRFCAACGIDMIAEREKKKKEEEEEEMKKASSKKRICPRCRYGAEEEERESSSLSAGAIPHDARFCPSCGIRLEAQDDEDGDDVGANDDDHQRRAPYPPPNNNDAAAPPSNHIPMATIIVGTVEDVNNNNMLEEEEEAEPTPPSLCRERLPSPPSAPPSLTSADVLAPALIFGLFNCGLLALMTLSIVSMVMLALSDGRDFPWFFGVFYPAFFGGLLMTGYCFALVFASPVPVPNTSLRPTELVNAVWDQTPRLVVELQLYRMEEYRGRRGWGKEEVITKTVHRVVPLTDWHNEASSTPPNLAGWDDPVGDAIKFSVSQTWRAADPATKAHIDAVKAALLAKYETVRASTGSESRVSIRLESEEEQKARKNRTATQKEDICEKKDDETDAVATQTRHRCLDKSSAPYYLNPITYVLVAAFGFPIFSGLWMTLLAGSRTRVASDPIANVKVVRWRTTCWRGGERRAGGNDDNVADPMTVGTRIEKKGKEQQVLSPLPPSFSTVLDLF